MAVLAWAYAQPGRVSAGYNEVEAPGVFGVGGWFAHT
jgi:hypothetical protein